MGRMPGDRPAGPAGGGMSMGDLVAPRFKIVAVLIEDDPKVIEAIAPHVLATQDIGTYVSEAAGSDALVNLIEEHNVDWDLYERAVVDEAQR